MSERARVSSVEPSSSVVHTSARTPPALRASWGRWARMTLPYSLPPLIALAMGAGAWELYVEITDQSRFILPRPSAVADALFSNLDGYAREGLRTFAISLGGLTIGAVAALILATLMAHSTLLERALLPIAIMVKVTPIVAVAPLFVIWFGFGWEPKVAVAALLTYFPVLINSIVGFRDVDPRMLDFLRSLHASRMEVFRHLRLPAALPYLFAALKIAATLSLIGAVVAEFFAAGRGGLGSMIFLANRDLHLDRLFAAVFVLAVIGVLFNTAITIVERVLLSWHHTTRPPKA